MRRDVRPSSTGPASLPLRLARVGKAAAGARALDVLDPSDIQGYGGAPALWLTDFAELLDAGAGR
jgi:hypothetical protein